MNIFSLFIFSILLLTSARLQGADGSWSYSLSLDIAHGSEWYNQNGSREDLGADITKERSTLTLYIPVTDRLLLTYSMSHILIRGTYDVWIIYEDRLIPLRSTLQKTDGIGDSIFSLSRKSGSYEFSFTTYIPTGNSDFYPGHLPTGTGRWGVAISLRKIFLSNRMTAGSRIRYLFPHSYTYFDYLGNSYIYDARTKGELYLFSSYRFRLYENFHFTSGLSYYHEIAVSKENLLTLTSSLALPINSTDEILVQGRLPLYGKYYPSEMLPSFFWEDQFPVGYSISIQWRGTW